MREDKCPKCHCPSLLALLADTLGGHCPEGDNCPLEIGQSFARIVQHVRDGDGDKAYQAFAEVILLERSKDTPED